MIHNSNHHKMQQQQRYHDYVEALEEEQRKIQVFQRELPLCLELVNQAINACKKELSFTTTTENNIHGQSECSEQTTSDCGPVFFEEFIPIKRSSCSDNDDDDEQESRSEIKETSCTNDKRKSDWLRSVQLWNQSPDPPPNQDLALPKAVMEVKRNTGAFQPFHKDKSMKSSPKSNQQQPEPLPRSNQQTEATKKTSNSIPAASSTDETGRNKKESETDAAAAAVAASQRKQRRCWSPELHRRFLHSLQQLGGSHVATPKQIRELMKVDGLTNDEVKSHLQKYRLHTRRPNSAAHNNVANQQTPQFVVVGGIWMQPPEYTPPPKETTAKTIYAPVAAPPPAATATRPVKQLPSGSSHSEGRVHSNSSATATSSSTHTTTAL